MAADSFFANSVKIATVVAAYWMVSISMVFLNSYLLSSDAVKLEAPLFITFFQCFVGCVGLFLLSKACSSLSFVDNFPPFTIRLNILVQLLPLSVVFVGMIAFNNLCLKFVGIAFYNVGRSLSTIFNVIFSYLILHQTTSARATLCCVAIILGFLLGVNQEDRSNRPSAGSQDKTEVSLYVGVVFGVLASSCVSLNAIFTKMYLPLVGGNLWRLQAYNNVNACMLFLPLMIVFKEVSVILSYPAIHSASFWMMMIMSGVLGMAIAFVSSLQIKVTSPLTHNVSGTAKACAQTVIAVIFNHEYKTLLWWFSNVLVLLGSAFYTFARQLEMRSAHQ